jgi:hypothetical protein
MDHATPPNPGTEEAQALGCVCPVIANCYGQGFRQPDGSLAFWMTTDCPIHYPKEKRLCQPCTS